MEKEILKEDNLLLIENKRYPKKEPFLLFECKGSKLFLLNGFRYLNDAVRFVQWLKLPLNLRVETPRPIVTLQTEKGLEQSSLQRLDNLGKLNKNYSWQWVKNKFNQLGYLLGRIKN